MWRRLLFCCLCLSVLIHLRGVPEAAASEQQQLADGSDEVEFEQSGASALELSARFISLSLLFTPCAALAPIAFLSSGVRNGLWFPLLTSTLARCGPAFIKWGQWAATRPDMFPEGLCDSLETLQSRAPTHSYAFSRKQVEAALEMPLEDAFERFEETPVASGSIAQVHRAVLRRKKHQTTQGGSTMASLPQGLSSGLLSAGGGDAGSRMNGGDGQLVAVKVRHPGVAKRMRIDFALMKVVGQIVDSLPGLGWTQLGSSLEQFGHTLGGQTRLDVEGYHLNIFNRNFNTWRPSVGFPTPVFQTKTVLVESWEPGVLISEYIERLKAIPAERFHSVVNVSAIQPSDASTVGPIQTLANWIWKVTWFGMYTGNASPPKSKKERELEALLRYPSVPHFILQRGEDIYLKMLLRDNLMHADLHPGNILVSISETRAERGSAHRAPDVQAGRFGLRASLILVDAGMVAKLNRIEQDNFIGMLSALGDADGFRAAVSLLHMSSTGQPGCNTVEKQEAFVLDVMDYFKEHCQGYGTGVDVGDVLRGILGLLRKHGVRIDTNYATLTMNVLCIESLADKLEPQYNVLDGAKVLLRSYSQLCLGEGHSGVRTAKQARRRLRRIGLVSEERVRRGLLSKLRILAGRMLFSAAFPVAQVVRQLADNRYFYNMRRERYLRAK